MAAPMIRFDFTLSIPSGARALSFLLLYGTATQRVPRPCPFKAALHLLEKCSKGAPFQNVGLISGSLIDRSFQALLANLDPYSLRHSGFLPVRLHKPFLVRKEDEGSHICMFAMTMDLTGTHARQA